MNFTKLLPIFSFFIILLISCNENKDVDNQQNVDSTSNKDTNNVSIVATLDIDAIFEINVLEPVPCGTLVDVDFKIIDESEIDSLQFWYKDKKIMSLQDNYFDYQINTKKEPVGTANLKVIVFEGDKHQVFTNKFVLLSDITPMNRTYKVIKEFSHDENAYTQGLVIDDEVMYEATGLETKSSLRKVDLNTGEVLFSITIPNNVFGEGITILNDKIVQITWQDHIGYVYDKESFQILSEFNYNTEGWGLTTDGEYLYMSDGTHKIFVLDPINYSVVNTIEVYDNKSKIYYLNELEFFNGFIYANVYTQDYIVAIDPATGKVMEKIDFTGLLPNALRTQNTDVLNGIAFDNDNNRIFVTGKNWPKLYQVEFK